MDAKKGSSEHKGYYIRDGQVSGAPLVGPFTLELAQAVADSLRRRHGVTQERFAIVDKEGTPFDKGA